MNYIVMAAGRGSRMGNLGSYLQKCMYPILEKPFLEYLMESLSRVFRDEEDVVVLVVGHHGDQIREYFGGQFTTDGRGFPIRYVEQTEALGTGHAVQLGYAAGHPGEPCIVLQGDNYVSEGMLRAIKNHHEANVLTVIEHLCDRVHNERVDLEGEQVTRAWKGTGPFIECGLWKFSPEVVAMLTDGAEDEYRALIGVQAALDRGIPVGFLGQEEWIHLGGTEPSVRENLALLYRRFLEGARL
jgi:NDP-sugar pyrophosphorylase family protein